MLAPYALTTREKVKLFLGIINTDKDALIDELINYTSSFIEGMCGGRKFLEQEYTELYDAPNGDKLFLNQYPITELITLKYRNSDVANPTYTDYTANDYLSYPAEGFIKFFTNYGMTGGGSQLIRVNYRAGFLIDFTDEFNTAVHTLPMDITMLANELVSLLFNRRTTSGIVSETTEGQSVQYVNPSLLSDKEFTESQRAVIQKYQKIRLTL